MRDIGRKKESKKHQERLASPFRRLVALVLVWIICSPWCLGPLSVSSAQAAENSSTSDQLPDKAALTEIQSSEPKQVLELREEAQMETLQKASSTTAPAVPLPESRLRHLAALLPPFSHKLEAPKKFEVPSYTRKPSPNRDVIQLEFPPKTVGRDSPSQSYEPSSGSSDSSSSKIASSPLSAQISPQGSVSEAGSINIEFDKPMVPITSNDVSDESVPVKVTPLILGHWRWLDTSRLTFEPNNRHFSNATTYQIEIPAGTKSQFGSSLEHTLKVSFSTPAPRLMSLSSEIADNGLSGALRPVIALHFNHPVEPESVLQHLRGTNGKVHYDFKIVHTEDFELDKALKKHIEIFYREPNVVLVQPLSDFDNNAKVTIVAEPGIKSLEGPNSSETRFQQVIFTHGPLKIANRTIQTSPGSAGYISFSNDLDAKSFRSDMVTVTPTIENLEVKLFSYNNNGQVTTRASGLKILGNTLPGIKYRVELSPQITDVYGQHLIAPRRVLNNVRPNKRRYESKTAAPQLLTSPSLLVPQNTFLAMTPRENPSLKVWSLNYKTIRVSLYDAQIEDWGKFKDARKRLIQRRNELKDAEHSFSAFTLFSTKDISTDAEPEIWKESNFDLSLPIKSGRTHIIVVLEGVEPISPKTQRLRYPREFYAQWIEWSPADLSVVCDQKNFYVMASDSLTGKPMAGAKVKIIPSQAERVTDANGLAKFEIWSNQSVVELRSGLVDTFLPRSADYGEWYAKKDNGQFVWYHKTDRGLYRPGDTVFVKGWVRWIDWDAKNDWKKLAQRAKINYVVKNHSGDEIIKGFCENDSAGAFTCNFKLPTDAHLGQYGIDFSVDDITKVSTSSTSRDTFSIGEFRRPEFELTLQSDKPAVVLGDVSRITAHANYRSGASFPNGKVHWTVNSGLAHFRSSDPAYADFQFGNGFLGGGRLVNRRIGEQIFQYKPHHVKLDFGLNNARIELNGKTNARGDDTVLLSCKSLAEPDPVNLSIESTVQDLNRQNWSQRTNVLVHPAEIYVGMKLKQAEFEIGEEKLIGLIVSDVQSKLQPNIPIDVDVTYMREDSKDSNASHNEVILQKRLISDGSKSIDFILDAKLPGTYWITAKVYDKHGRVNRSVHPFYVMSAEESRERKAQQDLARARSPEPDPRERIKFAITMDKQQYQIGDIATLTVTGNVPEGHGFLFIQNNRILDAIPFSLDDNKATIPVAVKESFFPGAVLYLKYFAPDLLGRRIFEYGPVAIEVPMTELDLKVDVKTSKKTYEPGDNAALSIVVKDGKGSVSNAQLAIAVVDESIFALQNKSWLHPRWFFKSIRYLNHSYMDMTDSGNYRQLEPKPQPTELEIQRRINSLPLAMTLPENSGQLAQLSSVDKYTFFPAPRDTNLFHVEPTVVDERHYSSGHSYRVGGSFLVTESDPFKVRSDVNALAYFNPSLRTGPDGIAKANFKLPGNLTKYRVMVYASAGVKQFGAGLTAFQTNMPLMVTPSLPRFLNYTDNCDLCLLVHNKTSQPIDSEVIVRSRNLVLDNHKLSDCDGGIDLAGRKIHLPPQGRVEVRIPASANHGSEAVVQTAAVSTRGSKDAAEIVIPLQPPITTQAFATSGHVDSKPILERVAVPSGLVPEVGGLKITTSSTSMQNLIDAGIYLRDYPFTCSEQLSSQILGLTSLNSLLTKFPDASNLKSADIREILIRDVNELLRRQSRDGSFGLWTQTDKPGDVFVAAQCTKALWLASQHGIEVPELKLNLAKHYVAHIRRHIPKLSRKAPSVALRAHALNVLFQMGEANPKEAQRVLAAAMSEKDETDDDDNGESDPLKLMDVQKKLYQRMSLETMAWLWPVLAFSDETRNDAIAVKNVLLSHLSSTSANSEFQRNLYGVESYWLYYSDDRLNAVILESLINAEPDNVLIPKLVKELLESRRNGCWRNTQENSRALVALSKYFDTFEKQVPDFVSQLWLEDGSKDGAIYSEEKFAGRSMTAKQLSVPMEYLAEHLKNANLILAKNGDGRLYYRLEMKYAQKSLKLPPTSRGFEVTRSFEAVGKKSNVTHDADGTIRVKAGAVVQVKLKIKSRGTRHHLALVDSLPAGFEVVDNSLAGNAYALFDLDVDYKTSWSRSWVEHSDLRDNRVEAFATTMEQGQHEYVYFVRATQLGSFIAPPCKIEEMYNPETFGRTGTDFVRIEESDSSN